MPGFSMTPDSDSQRRLPAKNNSGSNKVPPFGCVVIVDVFVDDVSGESYVVVDQPAKDGDKLAVLNTETEMDAQGFGFIQVDYPALALFDSADGTPGLDESWGSKAGSYKLAKDKAGFKTKPWGIGVTPTVTDTIPVMQEICRP
jgi:hypothetical protein